ncbi:hypothetical protein EMCG_06354 [[Emmonsia] crescens]|uniref:Uncharacterized protein n=1 Tax=[Emmonsia] crescens TaxID=73230 RepID=A0A0G2IBI5_9EURO|nr:hypothetical protein EMCG_06354 [Emmonsia crescens UAMH 3008]
MSRSVWTASLEHEQGVLASLSQWISSLFKMLAISLNPKPPHIQSPDSDSSSDSASTTADSISSFAPTTPPTTAPTSVSSSPSSPQQESLPSLDMFVKPAAPAPISNGPSHESSNGSKRPKLSLQTSSLPMTFGKSTTSLSLALSAGCSSSPTVRNTFNNAYDGFRRTASSSPVGASSPKCASRSGKRGSSYLCNYQGVDDQMPYKLPLGLRSILRNSPLHTSSLRRPSLAAPSSNGSGNGHSGRKVLFPAKRQVKYRCPLDEEIKTIRYVAKHSDILSLDSPSAPSDVNTSSDEGEESDSFPSQPGSKASDDDEPLAPTDEEDRNNNSDKAKIRNASDDVVVKNSNSASAAVQRPRTAKRKHSISERQIRAVALREDLAGSGGAYGCWNNTPQTPLLHQRRKRPRQWRWTLGPVENGHAQQIKNNNYNSSNPNPDVTTTVPAQATTVTASNSAPTGTGAAAPAVMGVPMLSCPSPKRQSSPLVKTPIESCIDALNTPRDGWARDPMCDILHEASSMPLPESLRSSPRP